MKIEIKVLKTLGMILLFSPWVIIIATAGVYGIDQTVSILSIPIVGLTVIVLCLAGAWISDEADICAQKESDNMICGS